VCTKPAERILERSPVWEFDAPKIGKKNAKHLVSVLGGNIT
jgi:hypothetical protein